MPARCVFCRVGAGSPRGATGAPIASGSIATDCQDALGRRGGLDPKSRLGGLRPSRCGGLGWRCRARGGNCRLGRGYRVSSVRALAVGFALALSSRPRRLRRPCPWGSSPAKPRPWLLRVAPWTLVPPTVGDRGTGRWRTADPAPACRLRRRSRRRSHPAALIPAALGAGVLGCLLGVLVLDLGGLGHARAALALLALRHVDLDDTEHVVGDLLCRIGERHPPSPARSNPPGIRRRRRPRSPPTRIPRRRGSARLPPAAMRRMCAARVCSSMGSCPHGSQPGADLVVVHTGANERRVEKVTRRLPPAAARAAARGHAPAASSPRPGACRRCGRRPSRPGRRRTAARRPRVGRR